MGRRGEQRRDGARKGEGDEGDEELSVTLEGKYTYRGEKTRLEERLPGVKVEGERKRTKKVLEGMRGG